MWDFGWFSLCSSTVLPEIIHLKIQKSIPRTKPSPAGRELKMLFESGSFAGALWCSPPSLRVFLLLELVSSFPFCVFFVWREGQGAVGVPVEQEGKCRQGAAGAAEAAGKGTSERNKGSCKDPEVWATTLWKQEVGWRSQIVCSFLLALMGSCVPAQREERGARGGCCGSADFSAFSPQDCPLCNRPRLLFRCSELCGEESKLFPSTTNRLCG